MNASNRFLSATESPIVPTTLMRDLLPNAVSTSFGFLKAYSDCFVVVVVVWEIAAQRYISALLSPLTPKVHSQINQSFFVNGGVNKKRYRGLFYIVTGFI